MKGESLADPNAGKNRAGEDLAKPLGSVGPGQESPVEMNPRGVLSARD